MCNVNNEIYINILTITKKRNYLEFIINAKPDSPTLKPKE